MPDRLLSPLFPQSRRNERSLRACAVDAALVIAGVVAATAIRKWLSPALGPLFPFATYSIATILLGCLWNVRSGVCALLIGLFAGSYYFTAPLYSLLPDSVGGWVGDGFYLLTNSIILGLSALQTRAREAAERLAVEAKEAREALGIEERRWRNLVEMITDDFVALDRDWRYTYVNENAARMLGKSREGLVGHRAWDVFPAAVDGPMYQAMTQAAAEGLPRSIEVYDAECSAWYENHIYPSAGGIIVIFRDVTERRRADQKVRELNVELQRRLGDMDALLNILPVGVWIGDRECKEIRGNQAAYEIFGLSSGINASLSAPSPELPAGIRLLVDGGEVPVEDLPMQKVARTGLPMRNFLHEIAFPDGRSRVIYGNVAPVFDEEGEVRQVIGAYVDYTERNRIEEALRESELRFRELADSMPQIVWTAGASGTVEYYNRQFSARTGMSVADAMGDGWLAGVHPDDKARTVEAWQRAVLSGEQLECEHRIRHADGSYRWLLSRGVPYRGADGRVVRWYGSATDIDDLKQAQEVAANHTAEVERLNERLRRAMAETHHRVKNNLQVITALVDMQTMTDEPHVPVTELIRIGQHIKSLAVIHDLLTANAKVSGDSDTVRTTEVMEKLAPLLKAIVGSRNIQFDVENMELALRQGTSLAVLVNELISNAVKHGSGDIEVSLAVVNERAKLAVSDRGPGFQEGFDPRKAANTGLELIESIGRLDLQGTTTYENRPEGGARVVVEFPRPRHAETTSRALA